MNTLFSLFSGSYFFERIVQPNNICMTGISTFKNIKSNYIECLEEGSYTLNNEKRDFFQKKFFVFKELSVHILNGNEKHLHTITEENLEHTHLCKKDKYKIKITIGHNTFTTFYTIEGPLKNMTINTCYKKFNDT